VARNQARSLPTRGSPPGASRAWPRPAPQQLPDGQPARQLIDTADDGLLVVGSRGRGSLRGALLGSISQQCAQYARGPMVVARDDEATHGAVLWQDAVSRVLAGVDGSAESVAALRFAAAEWRRCIDTGGMAALPWAPRRCRLPATTGSCT
jgi:universal stress protein family protein